MKEPLLQGRPLDSPLLSAARGGRGYEGRSPGIATLKEAFDITYAVHRMEEEGARRRKYHGRGGAGTRGFLTNLNEDDEEIGDDEDDGYGDESSDEEREHRRTKNQQQNPNNFIPGGQQAHPVQSSVMDGRAGPRDQGVRRNGGAATTSRNHAAAHDRTRAKGFQLDMDNATLLGRRQNGKRTVGSPLKMEGLRMDDPSSGVPMQEV